MNVSHAYSHRHSVGNRNNVMFFNSRLFVPREAPFVLITVASMDSFMFLSYPAISHAHATPKQMPLVTQNLSGVRPGFCSSPKRKKIVKEKKMMSMTMKRTRRVKQKEFSFFKNVRVIYERNTSLSNSNSSFCCNKVSVSSAWVQRTAHICSLSRNVKATRSYSGARTLKQTSTFHYTNQGGGKNAKKNISLIFTSNDIISFIIYLIVVAQRTQKYKHVRRKKMSTTNKPSGR